MMPFLHLTIFFRFYSDEHKEEKAAYASRSMLLKFFG